MKFSKKNFHIFSGFKDKLKPTAMESRMVYRIFLIAAALVLTEAEHSDSYKRIYRGNIMKYS